MRARAHLLIVLPVLAVLCATPAVVHADTAELTPCQGHWEGIGRDPWLDAQPYPIEVDIMDGARQCAAVSYVGLCTARWVDCTVVGRWIHATEQLVDAGTCAVGHVTLRCVDASTLELKWEGEPGIMEATLRRVIEPAAEALEPVQPVLPAPKPPAAQEHELDEQRRGCRCSMAFVVVPILGCRRRKAHHGSGHDSGSARVNSRTRRGGR